VNGNRPKKVKVEDPIILSSCPFVMFLATNCQIRSQISTDAFMMVDSPGMIDSPVNRSHYDHEYEGGRGRSENMRSGGPPSDVWGRNSFQSAKMDRGYDFEGVVRWFAERADVILLFFDPDKPGTTGETLRVLTSSLPGMDHKLYIILNKADQFKKIHDFARAYGSLCWNLSKVIQRKDLPRIYTMCLPVQERYRWQGYEAEHQVKSLGQGLQDLEATRDDVRAEVMKAPKRRIDNIITRLTDSVHMLQVCSESIVSAICFVQFLVGGRHYIYAGLYRIFLED
jgi:hypothetical protein